MWHLKVIENFTTFEQKMSDVLDRYEACENLHSEYSPLIVFNWCFEDEYHSVLRRSMYDLVSIDIIGMCITDLNLLSNFKCGAPSSQTTISASYLRCVCVHNMSGVSVM